MPEILENNSLYKYFGIKGLKRILSSGLRFTQPGAFNDPFELLPELVVHKDYLNTETGISFDLLAERRIPLVGEIEVVGDGCVCNDFTSRNIVKELNKSIGILCLSKSKDSLLMWSHYAEQYTGLVIEFDGNHDFFHGKIDIEYRSDRRKVDFNSYFSEPVPLAEMCAKPKDWEYEKEVRLARQLSDCLDTKLIDNRGFSIFVNKIPEECIRNVTLGERSSIEDQREIYSLIKNTDIGLDIAAIGNNGYQFRREIVKYPGALARSFGPTVSPRTAHIFSHLQNDLGEMARWMIDTHQDSIYVNNIA
jgi:hypothetical protein